MMKFWRIPVLSLSLTLVACGDNGVPAVQQWMDTVKKETHVSIQKVSEPKLYIPVAYVGKTEADPFNPTKLLVALAKQKAESDNGLKPDMTRRKEVLESFPLDEMKMVGIIEKANLRHALIQVDKSVFQAKVGNYVGLNFGVITKITDTEMQIKEIVQDTAGEWTERNASLELQEMKK